MVTTVTSPLAVSVRESYEVYRTIRARSLPLRNSWLGDGNGGIPFQRRLIKTLERLKDSDAPQDVIASMLTTLGNLRVNGESAWEEMDRQFAALVASLDTE